MRKSITVEAVRLAFGQEGECIHIDHINDAGDEEDYDAYHL